MPTWQPVRTRSVKATTSADHVLGLARDCAALVPVINTVVELVDMHREIADLPLSPAKARLGAQTDARIRQLASGLQDAGMDILGRVNGAWVDAWEREGRSRLAHVTRLADLARALGYHTLADDPGKAITSDPELDGFTAFAQRAIAVGALALDATA